MAYKPFKNGRYEYSIEYPSFLQIQYPLPTNGDGVNLVTPNGDTKLTISGYNNGLGETPVTVYDDLLQQHPDASYKKQSGNQVIFSWIEGDSIVYKKQIVGSGSINSFVIKYPISQKSYYNSIIDHLSSSFSTPGINDTH